MRKINGLKYTIKYYKVARLHITRYICKRPLKSNTDGVSLNKDYFPNRLLYLKKYIDSNDFNKIRGLMSLLYYSRSIVPTKDEYSKINIDLSSITSPSKAKRFYTIPS
jgi:hypothetical protein